MQKFSSVKKANYCMLLPFKSLINHYRKINHKHQSQRENNVTIVIIALERHLKFKVYKVRLATTLRLQGGFG